MNLLKYLLLLTCIATASTLVPAQSRDGDWLNGTWDGTGYQISDNTTWTMRLSASGKKYIIEYPSLKCSGVWRLVSLDADKATFVEKITNGIDKCEDDGNIVIERLSNNQLAFRYSLTGSIEVDASSILRRRRL